jgi:hypothetical protein
VNETDELREELQQARREYNEIQTRLHHLEWKMFQARYDEYLIRLRKYEAAHEGPYDMDLWFRAVRPLCRDCRVEVVDPYDGHTITMSWGQPPEITCGRHFPW